MKNLRKVFCLLLCLTIVLTLSGCGREEGEKNAAPDETAVPSAEKDAEPTEAASSEGGPAPLAASSRTGKFVRKEPKPPAFPKEKVPEDLKANIYTAAIAGCPNQEDPEHPLYLFERSYESEDYKQKMIFYYFYFMDEGGEWERANAGIPLVKAVEGLNRKEEQGDAEDLHFHCQDEAGSLYFSIMGSEEIITVTADGTVSKQTAAVKKNEGEDVYLWYVWEGYYYFNLFKEGGNSPEGIKADKDGNIAGSIDLSSVRAFLPGQYVTLEWKNDKTYLNYFNTEDGRELMSEDVTQMCTTVMDTELTCGQEGTLYLYGPKGVYMKPEGVATWEQILDPEVTPALGRGFVLGNSGQFITSAGENKGDYYVYSYDPDAKAGKVLTVFSLSDAEAGEYVPEPWLEQTSLEIAAQRYMAAHPDVSVQIHVTDTENQGTAGDAVKSLNTRLLAGEGEDIIMLDGLRSSKLIDKGILSDISSIAGETELCSEALTEAFSKDGKVYGIPSRIHVPLLMASAENLEGVKDLHTLKERCGELKKTDPDSNPFFFMKAERLADVFYPSCLPAWIKEEGFDKELFTGFLTDLSELQALGDDKYDKQAQFWDHQTGFNSGDGDSMVHPELFYYVSDLGYTTSFYSTYDVLARRNPREAENRKDLYMQRPGQTQGILIPSRIFSINQSSSKQELAQDFIRFALSGDARGGNQIYDCDGLPAVKSVLRPFVDAILFSDKISIDGKEIKAERPGDGDWDYICDWIGSLDTVYVREPELYDIIVPQVVKYLNGQQPLETTVNMVSKKVELYLKE